MNFDTLIIGSGASGLSLALSLAGRLSVAVISKASLQESATLYAQGGVSAVIDQADSIESHVADTIGVGGGLCEPAVVEYIVQRGRERIEWLIEQGVPFSTRENDAGSIDFHLTKEGGHSRRRVVHAADATGHAIETTLLRQIQAHENITLLERHMAVDMISLGK